MDLDHPQPEPNSKPGTRERLLDVAERVFAERGFAGASVREITDAAEANLGAINYYFRSKENLYLEVFLRRGSHLRDLVLGPFRGPRGGRGGKLEGVLAAFGRAFMTPQADPMHRQRFLDLCDRELIEGRLPAGMLVRELLIPVIETITGLIRQGHPKLDDTTARSCAYSFLAQLLLVARGARVRVDEGTAVPPLEERLDFIARFSALAIRHI
jgi:AcrR family transcriptional regulator